MTEEAPEKVIINGQEYDPEEANRLIDLGSKYQKIESDLNTPIDRVYPEFTKATQRAKQLETELAERTAELEKFQKLASQPKVEPNEEAEKIRQAAREIGLTDEEYLKEKGYMTKSDLDTYFQEKQNLQRAADDILKTAASLEKEIDGSDGRVPFDQKSVLVYANAYGINDLKEAYDQMNEKGNARWKAAQIAAAERPGLTTLQPGGKKTPQRTKITNDNLGAALGEWLNGFPEE